MRNKESTCISYNIKRLKCYFSKAAMGFEAGQGLILSELCPWHHLNQHITGSATISPAYLYNIPFLLLAPGQVD